MGLKEILCLNPNSQFFLQGPNIRTWLYKDLSFSVDILRGDWPLSGSPAEKDHTLIVAPFSLLFWRDV